jgi:anti-sigma factor (TIGR02949 family)
MSCHDSDVCEEMFKRLDAYLDRALSEEERLEVEGHLHECAHCACEYRYEAAFVREVREKLKRLQAPPALMDKIKVKLEGMGPAA